VDKYTLIAIHRGALAAFFRGTFDLVRFGTPDPTSFIHGVMNTDNMSIAGETIDYGPCAFMDVYHPGTVYSSIDYMY